ncbi:hypothetical protein ASPBRDRAFT_47490 [Aspergillus brasiliensis CBS 101740]|uniref:Uncharacterized protein n=1 Tax=Aspergillus brasiliensis (strain CBS 101740 / IMI 381727 / IBT 21946) TaxID=767769 RepID=A0A1L9U8F2_ASPBC|nr:hypothetical protein ASPBRDRAFT_47490 [Aspergillus brasiliensis CBS 101740]
MDRYRNMTDCAMQESDVTGFGRATVQRNPLQGSWRALTIGQAKEFLWSHPLAL